MREKTITCPRCNTNIRGQHATVIEETRICLERDKAIWWRTMRTDDAAHVVLQNADGFKFLQCNGVNLETETVADAAEVLK